MTQRKETLFSEFLGGGCVGEGAADEGGFLREERPFRKASMASPRTEASTVFACFMRTRKGSEEAETGIIEGDNVVEEQIESVFSFVSSREAFCVTEINEGEKNLETRPEKKEIQSKRKNVTNGLQRQKNK